MVLVEDLTGSLEVEVVLRGRVPRQAQDPFQVRADDAVLGGRLRQFLEPSKLAVDGLAHVVGQRDRRRALTQLLQLGLLGVALAELLLDRLQLLAQEVLPLGALHLGLDLGLDLRTELDDLELPVEDHRGLAEALLDVELLEQQLLLLGLEPQRRRDEVAERARVLDVGGGERQLLGQVRQLADDPGEKRADVLGQCLQLARLAHDVRHLLEPPDEIRLGADALFQPDAAQALDEDALRAVGNANHLLHDCSGADLEEVVPVGHFDLAGARGDERDEAIARDDVVDQRDRALLADRQGQHRVRVDDRVLERQDREGRGDLDLVDRYAFVEELGHLVLLIGIETRMGSDGLFETGIVIVRTPRRYAALQDWTSMCSASAI